MLGPPGTGKTTFLLRQVDEALASGMAPERVAFFSFSKQAVQEAVTRAMHRFGLASDALPWFRTIHSCAFSLLGLTREDVIQPKHLTELSRLISIPIGNSAPGEEVFADSLGARALQLIHLSRARCASLEHTWRLARLPDTPWRTVHEFALRYEQYKRAHGLVDFSDMLTDASGALPVDLLVVDEAQDSSVSQWQFVRAVARDVPRVLIAGDDDQAIFAWSGAHPDMLQQIDGTVMVLPVSYRLPRTVKSLADRIAARITHRLPKTFAPRDEDGGVSHVADPSRISLRDGASWLLLARSNHQLADLRALARGQGVVYSVENRAWSWSLPSVQAALTYERLRKGGQVPRRTAAALTAFTRAASPTLPDTDTVGWADVFPGREDRSRTWLDGLEALPPSDREYIRELRRHGESLTAPGRVRISTVHSAKGAEADHVVVLPDLTRRIEQGRHADPDAEHRVQYVAVTRARRELILVRPQGRYFWRY